MLSEKTVQAYTEILKEELLPAMGCTEPIAIAYAASILAHELKGMPTSVSVGLSGNIIKNVKSVIVPATGGLRGIEVAVAAGLVAACPQRKLEVLCGLGENAEEKIQNALKSVEIRVFELNSKSAFEMEMTAFCGDSKVYIRVVDHHMGVACVEKDGVDYTEQYRKESCADVPVSTDREILNVADIVAYAETVDLNDVLPILKRQVAMNLAIAEEGLRKDYGATIGKLLYADGKCNLRDRARAYAAAGSDARMSGCEMPVCILSGSGNQGITASVPVIVYASGMGVDEETMYRALIVADLVTIHQKTGIGCLSAYCGAISAGCGCGAGISFLNGGRYEEIAHTLVNSVAILSGTICDGAKPSCAAKIAMAVEAGILGCEMAHSGKEFRSGDGIITKGVEKTIRNVGRLAKIGMSETDREIIRMMLGE